MGWIIALLGILFVMVNPILGIGIFVLGVLVAVLSSSGRETSPEVAAISMVFALFIGGIVLLLALAAAAGVLGGLF